MFSFRNIRILTLAGGIGLEKDFAGACYDYLSENGSKGLDEMIDVAYEYIHVGQDGYLLNREFLKSGKAERLLEDDDFWRYLRVFYK